MEKKFLVTITNEKRFNELYVLMFKGRKNFKLLRNYRRYSTISRPRV